MNDERNVKYGAVIIAHETYNGVIDPDLPVVQLQIKTRGRGVFSFMMSSAGAELMIRDLQKAVNDSKNALSNHIKMKAN